MYDYRPVGADDLDLVCRHRHEMFKASGRTDEALAPMTAAFRAWLAPRLATEGYQGWIATAGRTPVAGLGLMFLDWPPHPSHPTTDTRGYILNVYVEPEHRGRGLATSLMALADVEMRRRGVEYAILHSTRMGRGLYEKLGWTQTAEMALKLGPPPKSVA